MWPQGYWSQELIIVARAAVNLMMANNKLKLCFTTATTNNSPSNASLYLYVQLLVSTSLLNGDILDNESKSTKSKIFNL